MEQDKESLNRAVIISAKTVAIDFVNVIPVETPIIKFNDEFIPISGYNYMVKTPEDLIKGAVQGITNKIIGALKDVSKKVNVTLKKNILGGPRYQDEMYGVISKKFDASDELYILTNKHIADNIAPKDADYNDRDLSGRIRKYCDFDYAEHKMHLYIDTKQKNSRDRLLIFKKDKDNGLNLFMHTLSDVIQVVDDEGKQKYIGLQRYALKFTGDNNKHISINYNFEEEK